MEASNTKHCLKYIVHRFQIIYEIKCYIVFKLLNEPVPEKTNNLGSDQVRHKPACTVTEAG